MDQGLDKTCNTCNKTLSIRFFHKQGDGYRGKCSICYSTYRRDKGWEKTRYQRNKNESITGGVVDYNG